MSVQKQLVQELLALAICGGSHRLLLVLGEDRWDMLVVDGRVGPLLGAERTPGSDHDLLQELTMLCSLEGLVLRRERFPGGQVQLRWMSAASLAQGLQDYSKASFNERPEHDLKAPTTIASLDALEMLTSALIQAGTPSEVLDASVQALSGLYQRSVMLHADSSASWIGPSGALLGNTARLDTALQRGTIDIFAPCGEAYEELLGRPPLVVLLPLTSAVVLALAWADDGVQPRPLAAVLIQRICRVALRNFDAEKMP
ncbi:MAG: hypothetical protein OSB21_01720 [Myxococcota bacterium]|nr:hypothetical protein [Myxococcota bacterium]